MKHHTEQVVLTCKECGEKLVLVGSVEDWRSRHAVFLCNSTHKLFLDDYTEEEVLPTAS